MSGPNPPGSDPSGPDSPTPDEPTAEAAPSTGGTPPTGETEIYSRAYSAPESEHFSSPYVPGGEVELYDYDGFSNADSGQQPPRWPWVVGVVAIIAAVALVVSVAVLVTRTENTNLATPSTSTTTPGPPVQDEITTTTPPPPPPPPPTEELPPPPPETVTITQEPPPPPPAPAPEAPPEQPSAAPPPPASSAPSGPRFITYTVTGTKAPLDRISVTYTDASGRQRTQQNVYIPWSLTVTPISMSEYGSVQASSLLRLSKLNCSITTSDGQTIASQQNNDWQTSC
jgi:type IV secretory pathway VirB10-like protein